MLLINLHNTVNTKFLIPLLFHKSGIGLCRDCLLPMLMNGQVSMVEVEELLGMVMEENAAYGK
ncbi:hypothetical protein D3C85_822010 [compost metagenome]